MSIRDQIAILEELSAIDSDLGRITEHLDKNQKGLSGMRSEVKALEDRLKSDRTILSDMERTRSELTGELRQMTQQIERSRERLGRSRNERESMAAQREVEELRKLHRDREDEIERLTKAIDAAKASINEAESKRASISSDLEGSADGISSSITELEAERAQRATAREAAVAKLPPVLYRRYESIRTRRPVAIARTHDGTCLGCHLAIPPMMFQKMRRQEEFEQCPHCRRILYYMPPEPKAAEATDPSRA